MDKAYPRFQATFVARSNGVETNITVRNDDEVQFEKDVELAKAYMPILEAEPVKPTPAVSNEVCQACGKPALHKKGIGRNGKPYDAIFCSTENKSHTKWL